jgi:hypothetical protein
VLRKEILEDHMGDKINRRREAKSMFSVYSNMEVQNE